VPEWEGIQILFTELHIIFHLHIEQCWTDSITIVNTFLQVEALISSAKLQIMVHVLQEIHLFIGKNMYLPQDVVELVAIDSVKGRFVVYEDTTFILMFLE
jgi:hypothetical protein